LAKIDRSGFVDHVAGSGRLSTARASGSVAIVEEMTCGCFPGHTSNINSDNFEPICYELIILLNVILACLPSF